jgi:hypothetical protein
MFQMAIKYINIFQSKAIQNLPESGFLVWKQTIWQPCSTSTRNLYPHIHTLPPEHLENPGYLPPAKVHFTRESFECLSGSIVSEKGMSQKSVNLWTMQHYSQPPFPVQEPVLRLPNLQLRRHRGRFLNQFQVNKLIPNKYLKTWNRYKNRPQCVMPLTDDIKYRSITYKGTWRGPSSGLICTCWYIIMIHNAMKYLCLNFRWVCCFFIQ